MNTTTIGTDGFCVFVRTKVRQSAAKTITRISLGAMIVGIILLIIAKNQILELIGFGLLLLGFIILVPMLKTILWNLAGEELVSVSTKSIVIQHRYGFIVANPKTYTYDRRLKFVLNVHRNEHGIEEGIIQFYGYNANNQPYYLCQTMAYISKEEWKHFVEKLQFVYQLDKDVNYEYSAN